jgi:MoaA/NifB/PqqE/SkfB family radical SAM enzyme
MEQIRPLLEFLGEISLFGYGEALLVEHLGDILDEIPAHVESRIVSNGVLLTPERNRMLVERGLKTLFVSVDAVRPETYKFVRGVDKFDRVVAQIADLQEQKRALGSSTPKLALTFVAMQRNIEELPEFIRLARRLGVDEVRCDYLVVFSEKMRGQSLFYDQARADEWLGEASRVAAEEGVAFIGPRRFCDAHGGQQRRVNRCAEPWEFIYFRADRALQPCCTNDDPMGAWEGAGFFEYWNSPAYQTLRRTIFTADQPAYCRDCFHVKYRDMRQESTHVHILPQSVGAESAGED